MLPPILNECRLKVDRSAIRRYADLTQDFNPIHLDPEFAARSPMKGIIAHGTMSLSLIWQALSDSCELAGDTQVSLDIRFTRPVREGDEIIAGGALRTGLRLYDVWVRAKSNERDEIIISGTAKVSATRPGGYR
jgi:3-hydroxybutyryl-CoA dehydratase